MLELLNTKQWLYSPAYASTKAKFIPNTITKSPYQGKLYGLPCIIGGTVVWYNKDLLAKAGVRSLPTNTTQLAAAATKVQALGGGVWGHNVPLSNKDFTWYFLYHDIHNRGTDIISQDQKSVTFNNGAQAAALQAAVDLVLKYKVQPPVGQYDREAGISLFKAGRIGFVHDEPSRLALFRSEKLPFEWDFVAPMGAPGGKRTIFSTTGHWVMASKSANKEAAWELIKYLSSNAFADPFGQHYGWAPVRSDVNTAKTPRRARPTRRSSGSTATCSRAGTAFRPARRWLSSRTSTVRRSRPRPPASCRSRRRWPRRRRTAPRSSRADGSRQAERERRRMSAEAKEARLGPAHAEPGGVPARRCPLQTAA